MAKMWNAALRKYEEEQAQQAKDERYLRALMERYGPCPACGRPYDPRLVPLVARVPLDIRCACCCQ